MGGGRGARRGRGEDPAHHGEDLQVLPAAQQGGRDAPAADHGGGVRAAERDPRGHEARVHGSRDGRVQGGQLGPAQHDDADGRGRAHPEGRLRGPALHRPGGGGAVREGREDAQPPREGDRLRGLLRLQGLAGRGLLEGDPLRGLHGPPGGAEPAADAGGPRAPGREQGRRRPGGLEPVPGPVGGRDPAAGPVLPLRGRHLRLGALVLRPRDPVPGGHDEPRPAGPGGQVLQRLLPLAAVRVRGHRRPVRAEPDELHLAAHFANIVQASPFFSQERAPTSVAYAETQSMFLDSVCDDAAWVARYARDPEGRPMPWDLVEAGIRAKSPYKVLQLRAMLAVPFFEKALYETPDADLTPESVQRLADEVETRIQGGLGPRPLLSVPHLLSDEASCYYHGYVLAEMAVHQTRAHFLRKYGSIVDNPAVGPDLTKTYWEPGNGEAFLDLVAGLTGAPLSSDGWIAELQEDLEARVARERREYDEARAAGPRVSPDAEDVDLAMQ